MSVVWLVDVPKAICDAMNAADFSVDFEAERSYADWSIELKDTDTLHVDVVPVPAINGEIETRNDAKIALEFDVGIRKRFSQLDNASSGRVDVAEIDALVALVQEVWLWLLQRNYRVLDGRTAYWHESQILSAFSRKDLRTNRQFTAIIRTTYHLDQTLAVVHE